MDAEHKQLKKLDPSLKNFMANGVEYFIETEISFDRWRKYGRFQIMLGYSIDFEKLFKDLEETFSLLNKPLPEPAAAGVKIRDIMKGVIDMEKQENPVTLEMCALFINRKDEDRRFISADLIKEKIKDWEQEGYEIGGFFQLALSTIPGFLPAYKSISQGT